MAQAPWADLKAGAFVLMSLGMISPPVELGSGKFGTPCAHALREPERRARLRVPDPEAVPEVPAEPVPGAATEPGARSFESSRSRPTPKPQAAGARMRACEW